MATEMDKLTGKATNPMERRTPRAALAWADDGKLRIEPSGEWDRIVSACGSTTLAAGLLSQAAVLGSQGNRVDPDATGFALAFVDAMKAKDAAEALLLTQMAATHQATMALARHLNHVETIQQKDCAERALNKTARTFAAQMDTLKRYRSKGQQTVRVERVTVEDGGQAVVGNVETGGGGSDES